MEALRIRQMICFRSKVAGKARMESLGVAFSTVRVSNILG